MYYYIMEPNGAKTAAWQEKIKDILGDLGIAGETVLPTPARTIEELASLGIMKGYSTIVAVGSEKIVNKVVTAIVNQNSNKDVVLGVIPDNFDGVLARQIGVRDLKDACQALKFRKLAAIDLCQIEPNKFFLTEAVIESSRATDAYLTLDQIQAGLPFNKIIIRPGLKIEIYDQSQQIVNKFKKFWSWLIKKPYDEKDIYTSLFHSKKLKLETLGRILSVKVDGETLTKTPMVCVARPKGLKLVVARDTIGSKEWIYPEEIIKELKINQDISASEVFLIDEEGKTLGKISRDQALYLAYDAGVDLVLLNEAQNPPLARLMDYGKYLYSQQKQESKQKAHSHQTELKEVRMGVKIGQHDLEVKEGMIKKFLERGDRVKVTIQLRGREMIFKDRVNDLLEKIRIDVHGVFETPLERLGNRFSTVLIPSKN